MQESTEFGEMIVQKILETDFANFLISPTAKSISGTAILATTGFSPWREAERFLQMFSLQQMEQNPRSITRKMDLVRPRMQQ